MPNTTPNQAEQVVKEFSETWDLTIEQQNHLTELVHEAERRVWQEVVYREADVQDLQQRLAAVERERDTHKAEREVHFTEWQLAHDAKIKLTAERDTLQRENQALKEQLNEPVLLSEWQQLQQDAARLRSALEELKVLLGEALLGTRMDSSWIRPITLPMKEREAMYKTCQAMIEHALSTHLSRTQLEAEYAALAEMVMAWARALEATGYVDHEQDERRLLAELFEVERSLLRWARRRRTFASPAAPEQDTRQTGGEG